MRETATTCPYCGVGCGVLVQTEGEGAQARMVGVRGDPQHPANFGRLCTKGSTLHLTAQPIVYAQTRLDAPELRRDRAEPRAPATWDAALDHAADRFAAIIERHGPDAVAFYVSGQLLTEDYYVFNKLAKGLVGTNNIDTNSRLCMSSAVAGYKQTLGADAPPACYEDIDHADCIVIAGSNAAFAHPVLFRRIEDARRARPETKLVVVDPRRTDTAACADLHLAILPGTDVALFHGMLHAMLWEELIDRDWIARHTEGFDALRAQAAAFTPAAAARTCGIREADLVQAARWFAQSAATLSMWCQGLNQSAAGTAKNAALVNLHLATGQIGRPGAGPLSLTGQPNAMGGREVGGLATLGSAHRELSNPAHRAEIAALWGVPDVPARPGAPAVELFDRLRDGRIRAVWIACTNPAQSMPDAEGVRAALEAAELVVVQDAYRTPATAAYADVLLPAATWAEKSGTVTNSERRISRVRAALPAWGASRPDWAIAADFARRLEARLRPAFLSRERPTLFPYAEGDAGIEQIWNEHRASTRGRDLDIGGLSYAMLDAAGPQQWPCPEGAASGQARLYADGRFATASGRARFVAAPYVPVAEPVDARRPFALTTGRLRDQWHGMSRTGTVPRLFDHVPQPAIEVSPDDAARRGWRDGELVRVSSRRGALWLPLRTSPAQRSGQAFVAMHWGPEHVGGRAGGAGVNALTSKAVDPDSFQPELKHAAVRIEPARPAAEAVAFGWLPAERALAVQAALRARLAHLDYVACVPFGRDAAGVAVRVASGAPLEEDTLGAIEHAFGVAGLPMLRYDDARRRATRRLRVEADRLRFVLLAGDLRPEPWLRDYLVAGRAVSALGRALLSPGEQPPAGFVPRGRVVCACFGVSETAIREAAVAPVAVPEATAAQAGLPKATAVQAGPPEAIAAQVAVPEAAGAWVALPEAAVRADASEPSALAAGAHPAGALRATMGASAPARSVDACVERLRRTLRCGSNCGSCLPEVRRLVGQALQPA